MMDGVEVAWLIRPPEKAGGGAGAGAAEALEAGKAAKPEPRTGDLDAVVAADAGGVPEAPAADSAPKPNLSGPLAGELKASPGLALPGCWPAKVNAAGRGWLVAAVRKGEEWEGGLLDAGCLPGTDSAASSAGAGCPGGVKVKSALLTLGNAGEGRVLPQGSGGVKEKGGSPAGAPTEPPELGQAGFACAGAAGALKG